MASRRSSKSSRRKRQKSGTTRTISVEPDLSGDSAYKQKQPRARNYSGGSDGSKGELRRKDQQR